MTTAARYRTGDGEVRLGRLEDGHVVDAGPDGPRGFLPTPEGWAAIRAAGGERRPLADVTLLQPVLPRQAICIGLNYRGHAIETDSPIPEAPIVFAKLPSALIGPEEPIVLPPEEPWPDYEAEMAIVMGATVRRADRAAARAAIGGVTAMNDVSGRNAQLEAAAGGQFVRGKSFDTFGPLGPVVADAGELDLADIDVAAVVSGEELQRANTSDLIFDAEAIVEFLSATMTLEPGDVIATGTPAGIGHARDPRRHLRDGDVVEIHVGPVGVLRNPVVGERAG
jgi:acylpyruvate hydrolase